MSLDKKLQLDIKRIKLPKKITLLFYCFFLIFIVSILLWLNWSCLHSFVTPSGDLAADMLLADSLKSKGWLLVGHYSRWSFSHPGPFWFYYNVFIEKMLSSMHLPRYQTWLIGSILINSIIILFACIAASQYFFENFNICFSICFFIILIEFVGGDIVNVWLPNRLIAPYLAFITCLLHLIKGNYKYLSPAVLFSFILIHGYVTMPIFTIPFLVLASFLGYFTINKLMPPLLIKKQLVYSFIIAIIFVAPLFLDVFLSKPSNLSKILKSSNELLIMAKPSWQNMQVFFNDLVFRDCSIQWLLILPFALAGAATTHFELKLNSKILVSYSTCLVITLTILFFYKQTPAPLFCYVAQFYISIPIILIASAFSPIFLDLPQTMLVNNNKLTVAIWQKILPMIFCLFLLVFARESTQIDRGIDVKYFSDALSQMNKKDAVIALSYSQSSLWPLMTGILLELSRRHIKVCAYKELNAYRYTEIKNCQNTARTYYELAPLNKCVTNCIITGYGVGIKLQQKGSA